jgi:hypothetical protein
MMASEWLLFNAYSATSWQEKDNFQWNNDEVYFVLDHRDLLPATKFTQNVLPT